MRLGCRVVRGSNWRWSDQDGGAGHVGTVVDLPATSPMTCIVQWDSKPPMNYRCGFNMRYDLVVFDTAPSGVKHNCRCAGCDDQVICGILWSCSQCPATYLCTHCYMQDKHSTAHSFFRINEQNSPPVSVPPRRSSKKIDSYGIFPGASVKRGRDWSWEDQDGGEGIGTVIMLQGWSEESSRSVVCVEWGNKTSNVYRLGHRGKTDLFALKPAKGWPYYAEHLPNFGEERSDSRPPMFSVGEQVRVDSNPARVKRLAEGHGQWHDSMKDYCGEAGMVHRITENDDIRVIFGDLTKWTYNPKAIVKIFHLNDTVELTQDSETIREFQLEDLASLSLHRGIRGRITSHGADYTTFLVTFTNGHAAKVHANCLYAVNTLAATGGGNALTASNAADEVNMVVAYLMDAEPSAAPTTSGNGGGRAAPLANPPPSSETVNDFRQALDNGRIERLQIILSKCPSLVDLDIDGEKALIKAVNTGKKEIVALFASYGVNLNVKDVHGDTILHIAIKKSFDHMFELFVSPAFTGLLNALNADRDSPLHLAVKLNNYVATKHLLGINFNNHLMTRNSDGMNALHIAIMLDREELLELFTRCILFDCNAFSDEGHGPLHLACLKNKLKMINKLLSLNETLINAANRKGFAPVHLAAFHGLRDVMLCLLSKHMIHVNYRVMRNKEFNSYTALHLAAAREHADVVEVLVEDQTVEISLTDDRSQKTPLHMAVDTLLKIPAEQLDQLIDARVLFNLHQIEPDCLTMAELMNRSLNCAPLAICLYLLAKGCNTEIKDKHGLTPMGVLMADKNEKFRTLRATFNAFSALKSNGVRRGRHLSIAQSTSSPASSSNSNTASTSSGNNANSSVTVQHAARPHQQPPNLPTHAAAAVRRGAAGNAMNNAAASNLQQRMNTVEGETCMWCNEAKSNVRFEPCNHIVLCLMCVKRFGARQPPACLVCKTKVETRIGPNGEWKFESRTTEVQDVNCSICMERPKNIAARCGHTMCRECVQFLTECPFCRGPMNDLRPVYL